MAEWALDLPLSDLGEVFATATFDVRKLPMGVDINEKLAAKYPLPDVQMNNWTQVRGNDGTIIRP